ncbi:hypothetical protein H1R20_g7742, partial [Candolleomyces eurysporus]
MPKAIKGCEWQHERGSEMMFDYIVKHYKIPISDKDVRFVKALIAGDPTQCDASEKPFLFDIIANKRNGLDVDKFDYIQRDSHMTGTSFSFEATRIVKSARVLDNQICYNIKDANQIYEICLRRFGLHKSIYNHKTARAIEYMIVDALLLAEPYMKIAERVFDPERFLYLNDYILNEIERSKAPNELWKRRKKTFEGEGSDEPFDLTADDIIVDITTMHYGMKEHNPVDFTKFYSKKHPDKPMHAGPGDYSGLRPSIHAEILLRIFTKKPEYFGRVYDAYNAVLVDMSEEFSAGSDTVPNTPTLALARTPDASSFETLPKTPGGDAGDAGTGSGQKKKRAFGRSNSAMMSKNYFADVDRGYRHESPSASTRRMSTGGVAVAVVRDPSAVAVVTTFQPTADLSQLFEDGTEGAIIDAMPLQRLKRGREDELQPPIEGIEVKRRKESAK